MRTHLAPSLVVALLVAFAATAGLAAAPGSDSASPAEAPAAAPDRDVRRVEDAGGPGSVPDESPGEPAQQPDEDWEEDWGDAWSEPTRAGLVWTGFAEAAAGGRLQDEDAVGDRLTLGDLRLRLETDYPGRRVRLQAKAEAWYDRVEEKAHARFRELTAGFAPHASTDVKIGRQILTWGTGDLLFLNDLFPKDFVSFFAGRDDEYLKAPSDALRVSHYARWVNLDLVWAPWFEPDKYLTGERFSFYSPLAGGIVAPDPPLTGRDPEKTFDNGEFALRLFRTVAGVEYAAYGYRGFFKQPTALDAQGRPTYAPLYAWGASLRRPLGPGLVNGEFVWYDSRDDRDGDDPTVPNSQLRWLAGYEWEAATRFNVGFQYLLEWTLDHDALEENSLDPRSDPDEFRHLLTTRLTRRSPQDKLTASLFAFWSPSDRDFYVRPVLAYRHSDRWSYALGVNWFGGDHDYTFFGQLEDNTNAYARVRASF